MALQSSFTCAIVDTITTCIVRMSGRRVVVFSSAAELGPALAHMVASRADKVSMLSKELPALPDLDCSHWLVGFCDDRLVPFDDGENTYGLHKNQLFSKINIPDSGVLAIDPSLSVQDYARKLKEGAAKHQC